MADLRLPSFVAELVLQAAFVGLYREYGTSSKQKNVHLRQTTDHENYTVFMKTNLAVLCNFMLRFLKGTIYSLCLWSLR